SEGAAIPEVPAKPVTRRGDLWLLGGHRLLCGDSTNPADVTRLMNGERAALFATDPPYLVDYDGTNHPTKKNASKRAKKTANKDWSEDRSEEHTSELQSRENLVCRPLLEQKKQVSSHTTNVQGPGN